ncbi:MAG: PIN domain-containing protein [Bacteroidota bacterium]
MNYVFDSNSLSNILNHYYPDRFPSFWEKFDAMIQSGNIISVREVRFELTLKFSDTTIERLLNKNKNLFPAPTPDELGFITQIYSVTHFQQNLDRKKLLQGGYFADPLVIAKAWKEGGSVVTEEEFREHAAKIPNICHYFNIPCENLEGFLKKEDWRF